MKTIWKFNLTADCTVEIPLNSEILCVQTQHDRPQMWVLVDPSKQLIKRRIKIFGTGHEINEDTNYIGTFQLRGGQLVFHVFEVFELSQ